MLPGFHGNSNVVLHFVPTKCFRSSFSHVQSKLHFQQILTGSSAGLGLEMGDDAHLGCAGHFGNCTEETGPGFHLKTATCKKVGELGFHQTGRILHGCGIIRSPCFYPGSLLTYKILPFLLKVIQ